MKQQLPPPPATVRRRPQQSRARQTSLALQHAFVRLLPERGFDALTIREIVDVAGTGLGSFYEYFANKDDLARVSVHLRSKELLLAMREAVSRHKGASMKDLVEVILDALAQAHLQHPQEWGAHYMLERQVSDPQAYAKMYERFVGEWANALQSAADGLHSETQAWNAARICHTIAYGIFAHGYICAYTRTGPMPQPLSLTRQARLAVLGYLAHYQADIQGAPVL
ncbi:TetR/AcrR family transcriptional regulator [Massilia sp. BJB1822]|uniref:TetR/AcrR family transcriptional regulator n=1 Tax=Massilia sp. BJB1822 TaxID=2744470 RepID=UPI0015934F1E|nr:TetR/AcrR family transcriptional regulator [Massilia sp. BJB1822]NVD97909.1 TetR/AcrR family transcriptional regulator [Massilia sp. BJB1822]